jgi:uncharacterized protein YjbJ (UPF0337 family)
MKGAEDIIESVGETFDDLANDAEGAADDMEKSFADYARETKQEASKLGREVSGSQDKAAVDVDKANEKMATSGQSKAREVAASFDGSADSIVSGFQGAAAEMFEGFGPAGAAAGLAAAAGLGLITAEITKSKEKAAEAAEATWTMAQEMVEAGTYMVTEAQKINLFNELVGDEEERKKVAGDLDAIGITWTDFIAGQVGLGDKRQEVEGKILKYYEDQKDAVKGIDDSDEARLRSASGLEISQSKLLDRYEETERLQDEAVKTAEDIRKTYMDAGVELIENNISLAETKREAALIARIDATPQFDLSSAIAEARRLDEIVRNIPKTVTITTNVRDIR